MFHKYLLIHGPFAGELKYLLALPEYWSVFLQQTDCPQVLFTRVLSWVLLLSSSFPSRIWNIYSSVNKWVVGMDFRLFLVPASDP